MCKYQQKLRCTSSICKTFFREYRLDICKRWPHVQATQLLHGQAHSSAEIIAVGEQQQHYVSLGFHNKSSKHSYKLNVTLT